MSEERGVSSVQVRPNPLSASDLAYDVLIGPDLAARTPELVRERAPAARYVIISDSNVAPLYAEPLRRKLVESGFGADLLHFPAGERHKTRESWSDLSDRMFELGVGRDAAVLAVGGGVTGDLAGFVAATYMRGLPFVQLPTSLLAMIDASVGGKTGVDTDAGKNLIGAFHQPRLVIADTRSLETLPTREIRGGLAEAVKHGAISDRAYLEWIGAEADSLLELSSEAIGLLIQRSVSVKAEVVNADEREAGLRKILNFGHTVGHAIEALSGYSLLHGEAIAIGMVVEGAIGERLGVTEAGTTHRLRRALERLGLPTQVPAGLSPEEIVGFTRLDKKARQGEVEYALIEQIGRPHRGSGTFGTRVPDSLVLDALRASETED